MIDLGQYSLLFMYWKEGRNIPQGGRFYGKKYEQSLLDQGIAKERIRKYGFAFRGKEVLIGC